jgi:hypothetical protein
VRTLPARRCPWVRGGLPQSEVDYLVVDLEGGGLVIEDCGFVLAGELVVGVAGSTRGYL